MKRPHLDLQDAVLPHRALDVRASNAEYAVYSQIDPNVYLSSLDTPSTVILNPKKVQLSKPQISGAEEHVSSKLETPPGYYCSPSLEELMALPYQSLTQISNFCIGKTGLGKIIYQQPINLSMFSSQWLYLFKSVTFSQGLVNVQHLLGDSLDAKAIVYLENVKPDENQSVDDFIQQLKSPLGMKFISYDALEHIWAFEVEHFSVWGLIKKDTDSEIKNMFQDQQDRERLRLEKSFNRSVINHNRSFIYQEEAIPGGLETVVDREIDDGTTADQKGAQDSNKPKNEDWNNDLDPDMDTNMETNMDDLVNEKPVEPTLQEILNTKSNTPVVESEQLLVDLSWDKQLALANTNFSIFNQISKAPCNLNPVEVEKYLFEDIKIPQLPQAKTKLAFPSCDIYSAILEKSLVTTKIRGNGYPKSHVSNKDLSLHRTLLGEFWDFASILYDPSYSATRSEDLCNFIQQKDQPTPSGNPIIGAICQGDIDSAIELSMQEQNFHIATLLTTIGQTQEAALLQYQTWEKDGVLNNIPDHILWIYKLLMGKYDMEQDWNTTVFLGLKYTNDPFDKVLETASRKKGDGGHFHLINSYVSGKCFANFDIATKFLLHTVCGLEVDGLDDQIITLMQMFLDNEKYESALYVLLFMESDTLCQEKIDTLLKDYVAELGIVDNDLKLNAVCTKFSIPVTALHAACAEWLEKNKRFYDAASEFITAKDFTRAYKIAMSHIGPDFVIGDNKEDLSKLERLLSNFMGQPGWDEGAKVYLDYINNDFKALKRSLPFMKTTSLKERVAKNVMGSKLY